MAGCAAGTHSNSLTRDDMREIEPLLREIPPFRLGVHLNVPLSVLRNIENDHRCDIKRQMIEVIDYWLTNFAECSWGALAIAVKMVGGYDNLAIKLNQKETREPVVESMEVECSKTASESMMVRIPLHDDGAMMMTHGNRQKKTICATQSCPSFSMSGGETLPGTSPEKLRSNSVSAQSEPKGRVELDESDFAGDSSPSPTEMEIEESISTQPQYNYVTVNAPTERAKRVQRKHNMLQIIEELIRHPDAKEFIHFVDKKRAPDYDEVIDYPMCLDEIKSRINRSFGPGQCDTRKKFCREFDAIVENCEKYNKPDSVYTAQVMRLKARFYELVEQHIPYIMRDDELELPSESDDHSDEVSNTWSAEGRKRDEAVATATVPTKLPFVYVAVDASTSRGKKLQIRQKMLTILDELKSHTCAAEFIGFVDEKRADGYYSVIDYPMCLNEIRDRINRYQCRSRAEFCDEFDAIIENCEKFNGPDSAYTAQARSLEARFEELVEQHIPDDSNLLLDHESEHSSSLSTISEPILSKTVVEESKIETKNAKDKVTIEELMELRHANGRVHRKVSIIKRASHKWKDIAKLIGCHTQRMKTLEEQSEDPSDRLKQALIENFIQNKPKYYTQDWNGLAELLDEVGLTRLAKSILDIFPSIS